MPELELVPGEHLGHYELIACLGRGGMGVVYRARDHRLERDVAVKVLPKALTTDPESAARFKREARILAALSHPNIVTIHSVEELDGLSFLTMELVDGVTLAQVIPEGGLALERLLEIAVPLAGGLAAAHARGVTHRDLKPGNVMVTRDERVKILDFGLAVRQASAPEADAASTALTVPGTMLGTVPYMSPEQVRGNTTDPRSDVFSFGCLLHEMATGRRPFEGRTAADVLSAILRDAPIPLKRLRPDLPDVLERVVRRCLEKEPDARFPSALETRDALAEVRDGRRGERPEERPVPRAGAATLGSSSVAVLPLQNISGDPAEEYFADGMTDALITDLAKIARLKVISRASVMRFKGSARALPEIARELRVEAVVVGSVLRAGDRVRISAQLVRAETDETLWAERYDRRLEDVLTLQDEVARAVAREVDVSLKAERLDPRAPRRVDPEVYLLDLRGRHSLHRRTEGGFRSAMRSFQEAIDRDATYAPAYVGLAESLGMLANYGLVPPRDVVPRARAAIDRALALDDSSADAHRVLAFVHWQFEFAWEKAIAEYERSLALDPGSAVTRYWFGAYLGVLGQFERSLALLRHAEELDPLSLLVPAVQGWVLYFARRHDEAVPRLCRVLELDPDFYPARWFLGEALVELGEFERGVAELERALALSGGISRLVGYLGYAYGRSGRREEARAQLRELETRGSSTYVPPYFLALVHAGLDEVESALSRLEQAYAERDTMLRDLKVDAQWDRLRTEDRFRSLVRRMGFPGTSC